MAPTWREQYDRMRRWYARLSESTTVDDRRVDDVYAFCTCCFHLKDWLKADSFVDGKIRDDVEAFVNSNLWLRLCADLADGSKHLKLTTPRFDPQARVEKTTLKFDTAGFNAEAFLSQDVMIVPVAGTDLLVLSLTKKFICAWDSFLAERGLLADPVSDQPSDSGHATKS